MTVAIIQEPDNLSSHVQENCCICRCCSAFWTAIPSRLPGEQVAICQGCAKLADEADIPTKSAWMRRERIACRMVKHT